MAREISDALLQRGWGITQLASNHPEPLVRHDKIQIVDARLASNHPWGEDLAIKLYWGNDFDAVLVVQDPEVAHRWADGFSTARVGRQNQGRPYCPLLFYFPVDGPHLDAGAFLPLSDIPVTYTQWGRDLLRDAVSTEVWERIRVVPHGTDTDTFRPLSPDERRRAREEVFHVYDDETFVVANVNRNTPRKDLFRTLLTVKELQGKLDDVLLYLHAPEFDYGISLGAQMRCLGLTPGDVLLASEERLKWSDEHMRLVYGGADAFLTTSQREGWGLTVTEAMACGCPVVAPDYGPFREHLDEGRGFLFNPLGLTWGFPGDNRGTGWLSDPREAAEALKTVGHMRGSEALDAYREAARSHVVSQSWELVGGMWADLLEEATA